MFSLFHIFTPFAEQERRRSREPWGGSTIPEETEALDYVATATTITEIVSESPRPATPTAVSSIIEDEIFDIGRTANDADEEEIFSETTTITTVAPIVIRRTEPDTVAVEQPVVKEEERTIAVGWGNIKTVEGEEEQFDNTIIIIITKKKRKRNNHNNNCSTIT